MRCLSTISSVQVSWTKSNMNENKLLNCFIQSESKNTIQTWAGWSGWQKGRREQEKGAWCILTMGPGGPSCPGAPGRPCSPCGKPVNCGEHYSLLYFLWPAIDFFVLSTMINSPDREKKVCWNKQAKLKYKSNGCIDYSMKSIIMP